MKTNTWQTLFTQLLKLAESTQPNAPRSEEAKALAQAWEAMQSQLEEGPLAEDYFAYAENTGQDTRDTAIDLVDQQKWYGQLQQVQLFVQKVLDQSS